MEKIEMYGLDLEFEKKDKYSYTPGEEIFNSVSHGIGALFGCAAVALMAVFAPANALAVTSVCVYGASIIVLYLMSCLYHALTNARAKKVFQIFDHVSIYLLIAGSYTPYCLVVLGGAFGWTVFGIIWAMALTGSVIYAVFGNKMRKLSSITYVIMGWMVVLCFIPLWNKLSHLSFGLLFLAGFFYTAGFPFYSEKRFKWTHSVFHLMVLLGSIVQFFSIFEAVCKVR